MKAGFSRVDITPCMGIGIDGYYKPRFAEGVLDPLEVNTLAISVEDKTVLLVSVDHCGIGMDVIDIYKDLIFDKTGVPKEAIIICATHTHTAPFIEKDSDDDLVKEYSEFVGKKIADSAQLAIEDLKPAKIGYKVGNAPNVAFVRRFRMKDGRVCTNPGIGNPDILAPIGDADERVNILRFDRENAESIVLMNFGNHPDVVGGSKISADWPGIARHRLEESLPNTRGIFINGAQGDVNHVNVNAKDGELNDLENDFDDVLRGYGHARHIANVVVGAVLQVYDKVNYVDANEIKYIEKTISVPANKANPEDLPLAHKYAELHRSGKDDEIPFEAMELTTVVAEALRMVSLENAPDTFEMKMTGIKLGNIGFVSIPGEGFTYIGTELKKADGWDMVLPLILANGNEGYFPTQDAYTEGGYEARSSNFKAGVAELFVKEGLKILAELKKY